MEVFQHSGAQYFDLGGGFHYSGSYPMVFQHSVHTPHAARLPGYPLSFSPSHSLRGSTIS
jgi:hypothetical protein